MFERKKIIDVLIVVMTSAMVSLSILAAYEIGYMHGAETKQSQGIQNAPVVLTETHSVFGTVVKVSGQEITIKNLQQIPNMGTTTQSTYIVATNNATVIKHLIVKDKTLFDKELSAFEKQWAHGTTTPPVPYTLEKMSLRDIKEDDVVVAYSATDVSGTTTFIATRISVQTAPIPAH